MIKVYSKDRCPQCRMTKKKLKEMNVSFEEINVGVDSKAMDYLKSQGFKSVPIVETESETWAGFQPDRIEAITK